MPLSHNVSEKRKTVLGYHNHVLLRFAEPTAHRDVTNIHTHPLAPRAVPFGTKSSISKIRRVLRMDTTVTFWSVLARCVRMLVGLLFFTAAMCSGGEKVFPGADEKTPSRAMYFDWINHAWSTSCTLGEIPRNGYLAIAVHGLHGAEGAYAAIRVDGKYVGAPDRSVSYHTSAWECGVREHRSNYTYYIPVTSEMEGKRIGVVVLGVGNRMRVNTIRPEVWITVYPVPLEMKELVLER